MKTFIVIPLVLTTVLLFSLWMILDPARESGNLSIAEVQPTVSPLPQANDNVNRTTSQPYTGDLSIFEEPERENNLQINRVMDLLKITTGKTVADIGAGSGWFTVRAAKRVGETGQVYAVEINQEYIKHIDERAKTEKLANITTVLGKFDNPLLAKSSVDSVLILKTYHEIAEPIRFLKNLRASLRQDALVGIIDRNGNGDDHGISKGMVVQEAKLAGFSLKEKFDFVKADGMDYFLVFRIQK